MKIKETPSPESDELVTVSDPPISPPGEAEGPPAEGTPPETTITPETETAGSSSTALLPIQITELFPNPAAPQTDAEDEFIELYNPNPEPIDLNGYKLQTGATYSYSYTFEADTLLASSYEAFYVTTTDLLLANSSGKARLINPANQIVGETSAYADADDGLAWIFYGNTWQWSTTPTPSALNILTTVPVQEKSAKTKTAATKKKAAAKPKTSGKKAKTKTAKAAKGKNTTTTRNEYEEPAEAPQETPLHPGVLAGVGGLTLAYGAYEYRNDVRSKFQQFRRYRALRRAAGPKP